MGAKKKDRPKKEEKQIFIDEEHDAYKHNPIKAIKTHFYANQSDMNVLFRVFQDMIQKKEKYFTVSDLFASALELALLVDARARGIKKCTIRFEKGVEGIDSAQMHFTVEKAPHYLLVPYFGYYTNPNLLQISYLYQKIFEKPKLLTAFKSSQIGYKYKYDKSQGQYYFQQEFFPFYNQRVRTLINYGKSSRVVEPNVLESLDKTSIKFCYDFFPEQRAQIFTNSFVDDPERYAYLKFSTKFRSNKVDTDHSSRLLMERALNKDKIHTAKLGLVYNQPFDHDYMQNNLTLRASSELSSNYNDIKYLKNKFFFRHLQSYRNAQFYTAIQGGYLKNLRNGLQSNFDQVSVNDAFYLRNFKGIRNIGYTYQKQQVQENLQKSSNSNSSSSVSGINGENLGFDKYLQFTMKIGQIRMPLFREFQLEPFVFANFVLAPNRNIKNLPQQQQHSDGGLKQFISNYGRASLGIGTSFQLSGIALECYYSAYVIKQKNELRNEFQINIGID